MGVNEHRMMTAAAVASLLLGACAGAPAAPASAEAETRRQATVTHSVLEDSLASSRAYGQAHLGHFLHLNVRRLQREGLEVPNSISLTVRATHTGF